MVVFKQMSDYKKDGSKYTQKDHIGYVFYIATRDGAVYGENLDHGLFGKFAKMDTAQDIPDLSHAAYYVGERFAEGKNIYRCAISLTEKEATELGFLKREKWTGFLERNILEIADEYNIKFSNLEFVASVHFEPDHPHVQFNFWDKNQTIQQKILSPPMFEKRMEHVRTILCRDIYADRLPDILKEKEAAEKDAVSGFAGFLQGLTADSIAEGTNELRAISAELCGGKMLNIKDLPDSAINRIVEGLRDAEQAILEHYPSGALKYAYLPLECKEAVDRVTELLFRNPDYKSVLDKLLASVRKYSETLGNDQNTIQRVQEDTLRKLRGRMGNQVVQFMKEHPAESLNNAHPEKPHSRAGIFDTEILERCGEDGWIHPEDIRDERMHIRIRHLVETGELCRDGPNYRITPEFKADVERSAEEFKQHKLCGLDKSIVELQHFTLEELRTHPANKNNRLVKRLPALLTLKLITQEGDAYHVTKEYASLYRQQLERFKQSSYEKWMEENVNAPVKIGVMDNRLLTLVQDGMLSMEVMEQHPECKQLFSRMRRLVAERYAEVDGDVYRFTPKFRSEVEKCVCEFQQKFSGTDRAFIEMERFLLDDIKKHPGNQKKKETDLCGRLEKKLPLLVAAGHIAEKDGQYQVTEKYKEAYYTGQAQYRQERFEKVQSSGAKGHSSNGGTKENVSLLDSEFLMMAKDNRFTQEKIERHPESGRMDWRLRQHIKSGLILETKGEYELTERFVRKVGFVQKKFLKGFSVQYRDRDFLKIAQNDIVSQSAIKVQKNVSYLRWRAYGLQFKELMPRQGDEYRVTNELRGKVDAAVQEYLNAFTPRIFDRIFLELEGPLSLKVVEFHPLGPLLLERLEGLRYHRFVTEGKGGTLQVTEELKKGLDKCTKGFSFHPGDMTIVRMLDDKRFVSQEAINENFRSDVLTMRLAEFVRMGAATAETTAGYRLTQEAIDGIKATLPEFRLHLSDRLFLELGLEFSEDDVEEHPEGILLSDRLRALAANEYLKVKVVNGLTFYSPDDKLKKETSEDSALYQELEPTPFDIELVRMSKDGYISEEAIAKMKKAVQIERRLLDFTCKASVVHEDGGYRLSEEFVKKTQTAYTEFAEHFTVAPCDHYFATLAGSDNVFKEADLTDNTFYQRRFRSLRLLEYVTAGEDGLHISAGMGAALAQASKDFEINHYDAEFVQATGANGVIDVARVLAIDEDYFTKRMYSLLELGLLCRKGGDLYVTAELAAKAQQRLLEFTNAPRASCYDEVLWQINGTSQFTKDELCNHPDNSYLKGRIRALVQLKLIDFDGATYTLTPMLVSAITSANRTFQIKGMDNRFLQINGSDSITEREMAGHPELAARLRELCWKGLILGEGKNYLLTERLKQEIGRELKLFAQARIGTYDRPLLDLSTRQGGFTLEDIKRCLPQDYEKQVRRLEVLRVHNLYQKVGERYFHTRELEEGVVQAEKRQQGIRRQAAISLLMDGFRLLSKLANQQDCRKPEQRDSRDLSEEAKKDKIAENSSASAGWEEYDR